MLIQGEKRCGMVDIDARMIMDNVDDHASVHNSFLKSLDDIADITKADIFLLLPKQPDIETASFTGSIDTSKGQKLRVAVYGDYETAEDAKTRVLILIDKMVNELISERNQSSLTQSLARSSC
jgi:hypothetical protein